MKAQRQTIGQLARVLDVDERKVSRTARRVLGLTATMVRDPHWLCPAAIAGRSHRRSASPTRGRPESRLFALSSPGASPRPVLKRDPCAKGEIAFGRLPHGLWVHPDVPDGLGVAVRRVAQPHQIAGRDRVRVAGHGAAESAVMRWSIWLARRSCCSAQPTGTGRRCARWMRGRSPVRTAPFALLDATLGLESDGVGCGKHCRRWRSGCATPSRGSPTSRARPARTPATSRAG